MADKFDGYDLLGVLVPGVLILGWGAICFDLSAIAPAGSPFPDAFSAVMLTALAVFLGQLLQSLASLIEPLLYRTWGGRPSDVALNRGLKHFLSGDSASRVRRKLESAIGGEHEKHSLFLYAMQLAETQEGGRAQRFNSLYAYHRGLLVFIAISTIALVLSMFWGQLAQWGRPLKLTAIAIALSLLIVFWNRAWQRACYYVREVLLSAERIIDERKLKEE